MQPNNAVWLSFDDVVQIYEQAIHAGPLLDRGKLEAVVAAPWRGFDDMVRCRRRGDGHSNELITNLCDQLTLGEGSV